MQKSVCTGMRARDHQIMQKRVCTGPFFPDDSLLCLSVAKSNEKHKNCFLWP